MAVCPLHRSSLDVNSSLTQRPPPVNGNAPMPELPAWLKEIGADLSRDESQSAKEKHDKDMKWVNEYGDNLAVAIALRDWDEAVSLVETGL
jgi:exocyst complex component 8